MLKEYIFIDLTPTELYFIHVKNKKYINNFTFDLLNFTESQRRLLRTLLRHNKDLDLVITIDDLFYLRKLGIRI